MAKRVEDIAKLVDQTPVVKRIIDSFHGDSFGEMQVTWHKVERQDGWSIENQRLLKNYFSKIALTQLIEDPITNSLRLAIALCFVDSRRIPKETRIALGLTPNPPLTHPFVSERKYPRLFKLCSTRGWGYQCGKANWNLSRVVRDVERVQPIKQVQYDTLGFEFASCMAGKVTGTISGLCFETTEFPNGSIFLKNNWYLLRTHRVVDRVDKIFDNHNPATANDGCLYDDTREPKVGQHLVVWEDIGGSWQPTRNLRQGKTLGVKDV